VEGTPVRERVIRFNEAQAKRFCTRLWFELTVAACEQAPELGAALRSALDRAMDAADDVADAQHP